MSDYFKAIVGRENRKRNDNDFYPTPGLALHALARVCDIPTNIWEPAAGRGHIAKELEKIGKNVYASDLNTYNNPLVSIHIADFLNSETPKKCDSIITNPPYMDNMAENFILNALSREEITFIAMLCRMQFINSERRYKNIYSQSPPNIIIAFSQRINCNEESADSYDYLQHIGGMLEYFWFVWDRRNINNNTMVKWVDLKEIAIELNNVKKQTLERWL
jgi:hypothetical protein